MVFRVKPFLSVKTVNSGHFLFYGGLKIWHFPIPIDHSFLVPILESSVLENESWVIDSNLGQKSFKREWIISVALEAVLEIQVVGAVDVFSFQLLKYTSC